MGTNPPENVDAGPDVTVRQLVDGIAQRVVLTRLNGEEGLDRVITVSDLNIPGLALAGFLDAFPGDRIQIIGIADVAYLHSLTPGDQRKRCAALFRYPVPCLIATKNPPLREMTTHQ